MHIQVVKGYQIITDCKEHLVNMTRHHWTRAPQLYGLSYCLMTFLYCPNLFLHLGCHKLAKPHNSHSSMSHKPYNQLCLVMNLSTLFTMNSWGVWLPWRVSMFRCIDYLVSTLTYPDYLVFVLTSLDYSW
jgi:hypothetical protein